MKYWFVSWNHGNGIYCTNLCSAENADDVRAAYAGREEITVREADGYEIESAKRRGMPVTDCPHIEPEQPETEPETAETEQEEETMKNYDYLNAICDDVREYIGNEIKKIDWTGDRDGLEEKLNDELCCEDSVTGNASGSYYCNAHRAKEAFRSDPKAEDYLYEATRDFGTEYEEIGKRFIRGDYEYFDVTIRCYLLGQAIAKVLDEMEEAGYFDEITKPIPF